MYYKSAQKEKSLGELAVEELAEALYKNKTFVSGLMKIFDKIKPRAKDSEIESFCNYWLKRDNTTGRFPYYSEVKKYLESLPNRKNKECSDCSYNICDGSGFIELKERTNNENDNEYIYVRWCKCYDPITYSQAMNKYQLTDWQRNYKNINDVSKNTEMEEEIKEYVNSFENVPF